MARTSGERPLIERAAWRALAHLLRRHPRAALGAAAAGVRYAAAEVIKDGAARVRRLGERRRKPGRPRMIANLAEELDEQDLRMLAKLGDGDRDG